MAPRPKTLITPALFSRPPPPPHREKRENSQNAPGVPLQYPSPGAVDGVVGRGAGVRVLGGGNLSASKVGAYAPRTIKSATALLKRTGSGSSPPSAMRP